MNPSFVNEPDIRGNENVTAHHSQSTKPDEVGQTPCANRQDIRPYRTLWLRCFDWPHQNSPLSKMQATDYHDIIKMLPGAKTQQNVMCFI